MYSNFLLTVVYYFLTYMCIYNFIICDKNISVIFLFRAYKVNDDSLFCIHLSFL